jgi:hypothetical protein
MKANNTLDICNENDLPNNNPKIFDDQKLMKFLIQYSKDNFAVAKIFIRDSFYTKIVRDEEISLVTFLGDTGGLLGLFLGVSLISFLEIFYHCFNYCITGMQKVCKYGSRVRLG